MEFVDADTMHPLANVEKMKKGIALEDGDRQEWLESLSAVLQKTVCEKKESIVLACSALKPEYREKLGANMNGLIRYIWLDIDSNLARRRCAARKEHYMPASLVDSQQSTLDIDADRDAFVIHVTKDMNASMTPQEIACECIIPSLERNV